MQVAHSAAALLAASPLRPQPEQVNVKEKYLQNSSIGDFVTHSLRTLLLDIRNHWNVLLKTDQQLLHEGIEQFLLEIFLRLRLKLVAQRPTPGLVGHSLAVGFVRAVLGKGLLTPILTIIHSGEKANAIQWNGLISEESAVLTHILIIVSIACQLGTIQANIVNVSILGQLNSANSQAFSTDVPTRNICMSPKLDQVVNRKPKTKPE